MSVWKTQKMQIQNLSEILEVVDCTLETITNAKSFFVVLQGGFGVDLLVSVICENRHSNIF